MVRGLSSFTKLKLVCFTLTDELIESSLFSFQVTERKQFKASSEVESRRLSGSGNDWHTYAGNSCDAW